MKQQDSFDSGVANADFFASGNYLFADVIDIGSKHTARITASLSQSSSNPDDLFDNRSGLLILLLQTLTEIHQQTQMHI